LEILVGLFVELFELDLKLALSFFLKVGCPFEGIESYLGEEIGTSMFSTCSLTVVVMPSLSQARDPVRLRV
jgi:hypothetical protein